MVRITQDKTEAPIVLNAQSSSFFQLLGMVVGDQPEQIAHLLKRYGASLSASPTYSELIDVLVETIGKKDNAFQYDLSRLLSQQIIPDKYDSYRPEKLIKRSRPKNVGIKQSPEQFISSSMHQIFQKGLSNRNPKEFLLKGKQEALGSLKQYQAHKKEEKKVQKEEETTDDLKSSDDKESSNKLAIIGIMGAMALTTLFTGIVIYQIKKNKTDATVIMG